ncbi:MAG: squalene/phytoene synthase family protein [Candidatus Zixiibacteriota bacterium]
MSTNAQLVDAYNLCEEVAGRDKPHLYAAAQSFAWPETRRAFAATYASMRVIDDFIDDIPHRATIAASSRAGAARYLDDWLARVRQAQSGTHDSPGIWAALADTFGRFELPMTPWEELGRAMRSDLTTPAFRDWDHLRGYMAGASVAPAVVFMHLVLMQPQIDHTDGRFRSPWPYERVVDAAEDLAIFCYWVHILRDVATDLTQGGSGLVYLPQDDLRRFGLSVADLHRMRAANAATESYRQLARYEAERARDHLRRGRAHLPELLAVAPAGNAQALTRLVDTYVAVLQGLVDIDFDVFATATT